MAGATQPEEETQANSHYRKNTVHTTGAQSQVPCVSKAATDTQTATNLAVSGGRPERSISAQECTSGHPAPINARKLLRT